MTSARSTTTTDPTLHVEDILATEAGPIPFDTVKYPFIESGPEACVSRLQLTLSQASASMCSLMVEAGPAADANGNLVIQNATALLKDCAGVPFSTTGVSIEISGLGGTVGFDGVSCAGVVYESFCYAGTFEFRLTGALQDASTSMLIPLTGAPIRVVGSECTNRQLDTCPMP